jgi:hypothetical protein
LIGLGEKRRKCRPKIYQLTNQDGMPTRRVVPPLPKPSSFSLSIHCLARNDEAEHAICTDNPLMPSAAWSGSDWRRKRNEDRQHNEGDMISVLIGILIIVVVGAICFWAIDKFATDSRLANLLKLLVVLVCLGAIVQRVLPLTY